MTSQLHGIGVSVGMAVGPVAHMRRIAAPYAVLETPADPEAEMARVESALQDVALDLKGRRDRAVGELADVLDAQMMMAGDPGLLAVIAESTAVGRGAGQAVEAGVTHFREMLQSLGGHMAERVSDLDDLRDRVVASLHGLAMPGLPDRDVPYVLVADDLAPADTVDLDPTQVIGLVTEHGGPTSHTAIIARALGLPTVVACPGAVALAEGTLVLVDGTSGAVVIEPEDDDVEHARTSNSRRLAALSRSSGPGRTADGHAIALLLNIGSLADADRTAGLDAEGVGLFRTELLFMDRSEEPSVDEQRAAFSRIFTAFGGRQVIVRTLDVGGDKPLPYVEETPVGSGATDVGPLGLRGWRMRHSNAGILDRQLRALAMAAAEAPCEVWTMAPMVATVAEAAEFVDHARAFGLSTVGVMVEVPSLALTAAHLMPVVDFVSVGTNDLAQHTFAADRQLSQLADLLDPWQPALLELVGRTARAGVETGTHVGVCGEAAADPILALVLAGLGCTSLSMSVSAIPGVRTALAATSLSMCRQVADLALNAPDARAGRDAVLQALSAG